MKSWLVISVACLVLSGCGNANWHSINRSFAPTAGDSRLIDAKQRAIISVVDSSGAYKGTCAEPSPDALQATAAALSGAGSLSKDAITAALNLAMSSTESAASIGLRTQTIQLLRDAYYRICEGYLSGGLDEVSYDILQRRFQNHMIALLAVEQLTGVVKAEQIALTSQSAADAGAQLGALTAELKKQREELNELEKRKQSLDAEIAKLKVDVPGETDAEQETRKASQKSKESDQKMLEALIADQKKAVAALQSAVEEASLKTITAQSSTSATFGGTGGTARAQAMTAEVAKAVTKITLAAINQDYSGQVCTEALRWRKTRPAESGAKFLTFCDKLLKQIVKARTALTTAAIEREKGRAEACRALVDLAKDLTGKLKQGATAEEAGVVLAALGMVQQGCESPGLPPPPSPDVKFVVEDQNTE